MTQYVIPLQQLPNQSFTINLNEQECYIELITRGVFMYMNLRVNNNDVFNGIICQNNTDLIKYNHLNFNGKLFFTDTQGNLDPLYYGLNDRWILIYED